MLKMYHRHSEAGGSAAYWEGFGSHGTLADRVRFCETDPLRPLFRRYLAPGATMLEGGCGRGQYVAYYTAQGAKVIGLDFARGWLKAIHAEAPSLRLCAGDVGSLPFPDATFDLYYSGGVVEHFEGGADRALAEARRVLKPGGILLISVPYFSPMRRVLSLVKREWRRVSGPGLDAADAGPSDRFYQYAYTAREFERFLTLAGLRVVGLQGYAILWGLYDVDLIHRAMTGVAQAFRPADTATGDRRAESPEPQVRQSPEPQVRQSPEPQVRQSPEPEVRLSLLKRLVVAEDPTAPGGWLVRAGRWACANMMMYVCTPAEGHARS